MGARRGRSIRFERDWSTWTHHTMDTVRASELMSQMIMGISNGSADGMANIDEMYRLLLGEGYSPDAIMELFRLKRQLQLSAHEFTSAVSFSPAAHEIFQEVNVLIH